MPTQASQPILPRVRILARPPDMAATMTTKTAVQVPWRDIELSAMEVPRMPEPAQKIQTVTTSVSLGVLGSHECVVAATHKDRKTRQ